MLWNMILWLCWNVPWLIIAAVAAMLLAKRKKSLPLIAQILGALGCFAMAVLTVIVERILDWSHAGLGLYEAAVNILSFLSWACLILFLVGYCWEKVVQWRDAKSVPAFPVV